MGFSTTYIQQNFQSNLIQHRNAIETRTYPEERTISDYILEHDEFREKCLASDVPYFEIKENYEDEILKVYDYIEGEKERIASENR
ncbi:hypothetical protein [Paenibacillus sp. FSL W7-1332]|uniref:hypothetical protein n=1 Tax=Paenibacillus sp. FSL W7-1332 TaxID=2921702 RepID=UPI0030D0C577